MKHKGGRAYQYIKYVAIGTILGYSLLKLARKRQEEFIASLSKDKQAIKEHQLKEEKEWKQVQEYFLSKNK